MSQSLPKTNEPLARQDVRPDIQRRKTESILLALVSLCGVWFQRLMIEPTVWCSLEIGSVIAVAALGIYSQRNQLYSCAGLLITPIVFAFLARSMGAPIAYEMTAISALGGAALALALYSSTQRNLAMSLVGSGFLVLFTALISDHSNPLGPAIIWMALCLWHMVANHWERVSACTPSEVRRDGRVKPITACVGLLLFIAGGWIIHGRASSPQRFSFGIMPTSGGSSWSDPAARSGIGSGDAAIAAKDHAESFGAVESEIFLESTESTLYDMFSDSIGQPKRKQKWERRQGMTSEKLIEAHHRTAKSERGGGNSFSTLRDKPKKQHGLRDAKENAVVQWIGPTGIRLAMKRFDTFDGVEWFQHTSWKDERMQRVPVGEEAWYFDQRQRKQIRMREKSFAHGGILKVLKLDSTRIPAPMMTAGVHIKDIDRPDFFGIDHDGSLCMPGREKIPPLTVLHLACSSVMEDELLDPKSLADYRSHRKMMEIHYQAGNGATQPPQIESTEGMRMAESLAKDLVNPKNDPYQNLCSIVSHLRSEFTFDRQTDTIGDDSLQEFLTKKRGSDLMFATTAAVMTRSIGLHSRLVTGFYVKPNAIDIAQGHASVLPEDVHVWAEVQLNDGRWIEIEPTPGYREPDFKPSLWLVTKRFAAAYWPHAVGGLGTSVFLYLTRVLWFEIFARIVWLIGCLFSGRLRIRVLLWILQQRAKLAGKPRLAGTPQRDWILSLTSSDEHLATDAMTCCDAADQMVFGTQDVKDWDASANLLVRRITTRFISRSVFHKPTHTGTST